MLVVAAGLFIQTFTALVRQTMRQFLQRAWYLLRQRQADDDLAEEMDFHSSMTRQDLEARGVEPSEAVSEARRAFGSAALASDRARDVWLWTWLQDGLRDLRFAARLLIKGHGALLDDLHDGRAHAPGPVRRLVRHRAGSQSRSARARSRSWMFQIDPPPLESVQDLRRFLEFHERGELPVDVLPINPPALRHDATKTGFRRARSSAGR